MALNIPFIKNYKDIFIKNFYNYSKNNDNSNLFINKSENNLRVLTFNTFFWNSKLVVNNFKNQFELINKLKPDIIFLQECTWVNNEDDKIKSFKQIGYKYVILSKTKILENNHYYGNIVFSRFPIKHHSIIDLTVDGCIDNHNCIHINIFDIDIFGTHLDVYDSSDKIRINQLNILFKYINKNFTSNNVIVLGDLNLLNKYQLNKETIEYIIKHDKLRNTDTHFEAIDIILNNGFIDIYDFINKDSPKLTCCFDRRIDYIFVKKDNNLHIEDINCIITNTSDHYPLIVDIKYKNIYIKPLL